MRGRRAASAAIRVAVAAGVLMGLGSPVQSATFPGGSLGSIPDGGTVCPTSGDSLDVSFVVSGLTAPVADVDVSMLVNHTWVGDVSATLIAPDGTEAVLFARTGSVQGGVCSGDSSDLAGIYNFDIPSPATNWWTEAAAQGAESALTPGDYWSTEAGGETQTENPAPFTDFTRVFNGLPAATANGIWILRFRDFWTGFTGQVLAASLGINEDCGQFGRLVSGSTNQTEALAECGPLVLMNYTVLAPDGNLTLTSATAVVLDNGFVVETGAELVAEINPTIDPMRMALEYSALMGLLERLEEAEDDGRASATGD